MVYTEFKLFVGGLSWDTTSDGLKEAFLPFGEIPFFRVCSDQETGNSRGFGFVSFLSEAEGPYRMVVPWLRACQQVVCVLTLLTAWLGVGSLVHH